MVAKREHSCFFILSTQFLIVHVHRVHRYLTGDDGQVTGGMGCVYVMHVVKVCFSQRQLTPL